MIAARWLALVAFIAASSSAIAHDIWINRKGLTNPITGVGCCGAEDCGVVLPTYLNCGLGGCFVAGTIMYGAAVTGNEDDGPTRLEPVREWVPYFEVQPSPDGQIWRCKKPNGERRCFFAPQPRQS